MLVQSLLQPVKPYYGHNDLCPVRIHWSDIVVIRLHILALLHESVIKRGITPVELAHREAVAPVTEPIIETSQ